MCANVFVSTLQTSKTRSSKEVKEFLQFSSYKTTGLLYVELSYLRHWILSPLMVRKYKYLAEGTQWTGFPILYKIGPRSTSGKSAMRGESRHSDLCVHVYRQNSAHSGATSTHEGHGATHTVRKTMQMGINNTPQAVNRTSKYMKKNKGRNANYTMAQYCYQGVPVTSSYYCYFATRGNSWWLLSKSDIDTEEWRAWMNARTHSGKTNTIITNAKQANGLLRAHK